MSTFRIYHNPACRHSRESLQILQEEGEDVEVIHYLDTPPSEDEVWEILELLGVPAIHITRTNEPEFEEMGLSKTSDDEELVQAIATHPILLQRPIIIKDDAEAVIGRPAEMVHELL